MAKTHVDKRTLNCRLGNRKPTEKQRKLIKARLEGKSVEIAGKEAGYCNKRAAYQALNSPTVQKWVKRSFKKHGLDDLTITKPLRDALQAACFDKFGNEVPDWPVRLKAHELQVKLLGVLPAEKHQLEVNQPRYQIVNILRFSEKDLENPKPLKQTIRNLDAKEEIVLEGEATLTDSEIPSALRQIGSSTNRLPETQPQIENKSPANTDPFKS